MKISENLIGRKVCVTLKLVFAKDFVML